MDNQSDLSLDVMRRGEVAQLVGLGGALADHCLDRGREGLTPKEVVLRPAIGEDSSVAPGSQ
eukprot:1270065-Alexandrium_andersonii.AAC.1